jgi:ABC-type molybdate transport system permease subunit
MALSAALDLDGVDRVDPLRTAAAFLMAQVLAVRRLRSEQRMRSSNARSRRIVDSIATVALWARREHRRPFAAALHRLRVREGRERDLLALLDGFGAEFVGSGRRRGAADLQLVLSLDPHADLHRADLRMRGHVSSGVRCRRALHDDLVQFSAESLATVPSIVMGLFGLLVFVTTFHWGFTAIGGALTLTLLNLPSMMRVTQEALAGVPGTYREASMGLGATKWQTVLKVILPSAIGPLTTGVVLVSGRIFGETAALIYTAGASVTFNHPYDWSLGHTAETLSVGLYQVHREALVPDADRIANGSALVLLVMVLIFNIVARVVGRQLTIRLTGKA